MFSPSFTASWMVATAREITSLPTVSFTMFSACSTGTPAAISVPSVRVKREIEFLLISLPNTGACSLKRSRA